jgi:hypothetical protein
MSARPQHVRTITFPPVVFELSPDPWPDGYREAAVMSQLLGGITAYKGRPEVFWAVVSAGRRLDTAHLMFERVRHQLANGDLLAPPTPWSEEHVELCRRLAILGDAQLAASSLHAAAKAVRGVPAVARQHRFKVPRAFPAKVERRMQSLFELRNAYEHADARARGEVNLRRDVDVKKAHRAFDRLGQQLEMTRTIRYRRYSLGIDQPASDLMVALRQFLRDVWWDVCHEEQAGRQARRP